MLKRINFKVLVLFVVSVLLLSSCIDNDEVTESKGDITSEQASAVESSDTIEESSETVSEDEQSVAESSEEVSQDELISEEPSMESSEGGTESTIIKLCVPDAEYMNFEYKEVTFDGTMDGIINKLAKEKLFSEDVKVNSFEIEGDTIRIDLSEEFGFAIATGTLAERMIVCSLVNTLVLYYDVEQVYFTVGGDCFDSGHVYYDFPLTFTEKLG